MNSKLIRDQAIILSGVSIDPVYSRRWQNEAMDVLSTLYDTACIYVYYPMVITDRAINHDLPDDYLSVKEVRYPTDGSLYKKYTASPQGIRFQDEGTYTVTYLRKPVPITGDGNVPEVNVAYHYVIALLEAARELSRSNPTHPKIDKLESEFYAMADKVNIRLARAKRSGLQMPKMTWR